MPKDLMSMRRLLKFLTGRHNMKGSFERLEGFKSTMAVTDIVGIPNYGSATGSAPLAPLYVGYLPYSIHCLAPAMDNFTNYPARGLSSGMAGCLQAICPQECSGYLWPGGLGECSMPAHRGAGWGAHFLHNAANLTHISGQFDTINTDSSYKQIRH